MSLDSAEPTHPIYSAYFLRLELEAVRSFHAKQILDLSRNHKPAAWTILLGDNGTGKSTLLQMIAILRPDSRQFAVDHGLEAHLEARGAISAMAAGASTC